MDEQESRYESFKKMRKLLGLPDPDMPADVYSDSDEDDDSQADDDDWIQKQCNSMLEIFGIVYLGKDFVEPRNQLGRIYMDTPVGILDIYNVDKVDEETRETIKHGDEFDIADIKGPIPFRNDCNSLYFDLFCGTYKGKVHDKFSYKGKVHETFSDIQFISRDDVYLRKLKLDSIDGSGAVAILMGFYAHATVARVEVRLDTSVATKLQLHGSVSAANTELDELMATSMLFFKEKHKGITIGTDGLIPLSRSRVAVPYQSDLYLDVSLVVDGHPLQTIMCFSARKARVSTKCFKNLSVTVNWEALYYHSKKKVNEA